LSKKKFILDYDDATFHVYDNHPNRLIRWLYGDKIGKLMSHSSIVLAGNQYLYSYALNSGAKNVTLFPSVIDLESYCFASLGPKVIEGKVEPLYIVWVGSPSTEKYLNLLSVTLKKISKKYNLILRVISYQSKLTMEGVNIEHIEWSESTALQYISTSDIGIMPLIATPWELGKCGYKLIQYMGCSLPVIATKVGANIEIVNDGISGFLVNSLEEWESAFYRLMDNRLLREQMGHAGRLIVEDRYCSQVSGKTLIKLLLEI
jgi:glycosyltransferase involved in cell wall biosynthesis